MNLLDCCGQALVSYNWTSAWKRKRSIFLVLVIGRLAVVTGWLLLTGPFPLLCWFPVDTARRFEFFTKMQGLAFVFFAFICPYIASVISPETIAHVARENREETVIVGGAVGHGAAGGGGGGGSEEDAPLNNIGSGGAAVADD